MGVLSKKGPPESSYLDNVDKCGSCPNKVPLTDNYWCDRANCYIYKVFDCDIWPKENYIDKRNNDKIPR